MAPARHLLLWETSEKDGVQPSFRSLVPEPVLCIEMRPSISRSTPMPASLLTLHLTPMPTPACGRPTVQWLSNQIFQALPGRTSCAKARPPDASWLAPLLGRMFCDPMTTCITSFLCPRIFFNRQVIGPLSQQLQATRMVLTELKF